MKNIIKKMIGIFIKHSDKFEQNIRLESYKRKVEEVRSIYLSDRKINKDKLNQLMVSEIVSKLIENDLIKFEEYFDSKTDKFLYRASVKVLVRDKEND